MRRVGHRVERHERIGSTNDRARALLDEPDGDGAVVLAEEQDAGRGRRGRTWLSPPGRNLLVSVALRPRVAAGDAWRLGLATALAVADACDSDAPVALKWPNDVVAAGDGRKVAGLLIETMAEGDRLRGAVLGIGINANWRRHEMPDEIRDSATSLADVAGRGIDRDALLNRLIVAIYREIRAVEDGASPLDRYRARCATLGQEVEVAAGSGTITGVATDLDSTGALVVDGPGGRRVLAGGEVVRLRPVVTA
jgi:BirA family transcriptional regulator, biotin operon repressor / biotin---[acetyl-CoA-carboxylase] ligase